MKSINSIWNRMGTWRTAILAAIAAVVMVGLKLLAVWLNWDVVHINALFTSIIAGGIFLFSLILAGTLTDYKESERIPAEIISACESIYGEGLSVKARHADFDLEYLRGVLGDIADGFVADAGNEDSRLALEATAGLRRSYAEMEDLGVPPNFITRLKSEESAMRKSLLRMYYIQRTGFLPSAYILVESIVVLILGLLVFVEIEPLYSAIIVMVVLTYLFVYILKLLKTLDRPFRQGETTKDDVSLFLFHEFRAKLDEP